MNVELSSRHDELVTALYDIRDKFKDASLDERLIVEAAIHLLEYLPDYKHAADREEAGAAPQDVEWMSGRIGPFRSSQFTWTLDDFERYIASGGVELHAGRVEPRL